MYLTKSFIMSSKSTKSCNMPQLKYNIFHELRMWHDWNGLSSAGYNNWYLPITR